MDGDEFEIGNEEENFIDVDIDSDDDVEGTLLVKIDNATATLKYDNDEDYFYIINDGKGSAVTINEDFEPSLCIDKMLPGTYKIEIQFKARQNIYSVSKTATIKIFEPGTLERLTIDSEDEETFILGNDNAISIIVSKDLIDTINVKINNKNYPFTKQSSTQGYVNISQLGKGTYELVVKSGNLSDSISFTIVDSSNVPVTGSIMYPDDDIVYGSQKIIYLRLSANATGNLLIMDKKGNVVFNESLEDGFAGYSLANLKAGDYEYTATYTGWDYDVDDEDIDIRVIPLITIPSIMNVGENKMISIDFGGTVNGTLYILVDQDPYRTIKLSGPIATVPLKDLDDGEYLISVVYNDDEGFFFDMEYEIEVLPVKPRLTENKNIVMNYNDGTTYTVKVYGFNGKPVGKNEYVEIKIGKKTYERFTDKNSRVTLKINDLPGKYMITAIYEGVNVQNTLVINHMVSLKKVNVKKSAEKLVLTAKLKKAFKGKQIVFKFNGKKYKAKTDKKGVAKVTVKSDVLSKLKVGKKVTYQASYLKDTVKQSVKVGK